MRKWLHTVNFKPFWNRDDMSIEEKGTAAAVELKRVFPDWESGDDLEYIVGDFEEVDRLEAVAPVEIFDSAMSDLYDWADKNSVWVATNF